MIQIEKIVDEERKLGYMILQIHDEFIFEIPDFEVLDLKTIVKKQMEEVFKLKSSIDCRHQCWQKLERMLKLRKVAVTGGLSCGKSTVCHFFKRSGFKSRLRR